MRSVDGLLVPDFALDPEFDISFTNRLPVYKCKGGTFVVEVLED